jgi:hypothetical protein
MSKTARMTWNLRLWIRRAESGAPSLFRLSSSQKRLRVYIICSHLLTSQDYYGTPSHAAYKPQISVLLREFTYEEGADVLLRLGVGWPFRCLYTLMWLVQHSGDKWSVLITASQCGKL